ILGRFLENPDALFFPARLLLGLVTALTAVLLAEYEGVGRTAHGIWLFLASMLSFVVVCFHVVPQLIVRRDPQRVLEALLPSFAVVSSILGPVTRAVGAVPGERRPDDEHAEGGAENGAAEDDPGGPPEEPHNDGARELFRSLVGFQDRLVREVMTPRPDIVAIPQTATLGELRALLKDSEYSRLLVYGENLDNVVGFVHMKDVFLKGNGHPDGDPITPLVRPAHVVPETKRVPDLLREFQQRQSQAALVVDEYGGTAGLVTVEDLLEELVGEIRDEYDVEAEPIVEEDDDTFVFSAKVDIDALMTRLGVEIERDGFETIGGYLMTRLGRVPAVGEQLAFDGLAIDVLEAERRRVLKVRVRRAPRQEDEA